jgi:hypothetical protein
VGESTADPRRLRVRSGLGFVQFLRPALYALLVLSAVFTFWAGGQIAGHSLPRWTHVAAPTLFAIFLVVFAIYRFALVRARKYPAAIALFQVGLGALIWVLLLPSARAKFGPGANRGDEVAALMSSADPRVRALAAETAGYREGGTRYAAELIDRLDDGDPRVQSRARASLARLAGTDAGPSAAAWRELARQRGWMR